MPRLCAVSRVSFEDATTSPPASNEIGSGGSEQTSSLSWTGAPRLGLGRAVENGTDVRDSITDFQLHCTLRSSFGARRDRLVES
jgi:hypothetical protein